MSYWYILSCNGRAKQLHQKPCVAISLLGTVVWHASSPSIWEAEAGGLYKPSLSYAKRLCLKKIDLQYFSYDNISGAMHITRS